jgi:hypothetical protein
LPEEEEEEEEQEHFLIVNYFLPEQLQNSVMCA